MIPSIPTYLAHEELFFQPVFGSTGPRQAWLSVVGLAANHQAIEEEDVALVLGTYPCQRALHYKLVAALADVFALPAIDVPLDLVHLLDGQVLALHLLTVEAAGRLAREGEPRGKGKKKKAKTFVQSQYCQGRGVQTEREGVRTKAGFCHSQYFYTQALFFNTENRNLATERKTGFVYSSSDSATWRFLVSLKLIAQPIEI